jgi:hypothetical protein
MNGSRMANPSNSVYPHAEIWARLGRAVWSIVRIPILVFLIVLEPIVSFLLVGLSLLGIFMAFFWKWTSADPRLPFWAMLGISIGLGVTLFLYEGLINFFSRR